MAKEVTRNNAKCRKCGDVIESKTRHDFVTCKCGAISVDGGQDYCRRAGKPEDFLPVECTCPHLQVGTSTLPQKNLSPDCPVHGEEHDRQADKLFGAAAVADQDRAQIVLEEIANQEGGLYIVDAKEEIHEADPRELARALLAAMEMQHLVPTVGGRKTRQVLAFDAAIAEIGRE